MIKLLNSRYKDSEERKQVIQKIQDVRNGNSFEYFKQEFYDPNTNEISDDTKRKLLMDTRVLAQVLDFFISFCPILKPKVVSGKNKKNIKKKDRLVKKAMKKIRWDTINPQIYDILETEGDCFFYIYFDDEEDEDGDIIPNITLLDSKNMINAIVNNMNNKTIAYIYEAEDIVETVNYTTGEVDIEDNGQFVYIFEKGKSSKIGKKAGTTEEGMLVEQEGDLIIKTKDNKESYAEIIPIIHISSDKKANEKFSIIPAEDYVSLCLKLMAIQSDIRATNRQMGFPRITALDCTYVAGDGRIGGIRVAKSIKDKDDEDDEPRKGQIIEHKASTNQAMFEEENRLKDALYDLVGVTNPTLMKRVGSSDSSKVIQQVNTRMEAKITRYVDNIIEEFKKYFMVLFKENQVYEDDYDIDYSFTKPRNIIKNSKYDELLQDDLELKTGQATIKDLLMRNGKNLEQIDEHFKEVNYEKVNGGDDISRDKEIKKEVAMEVRNANATLES